MDLNFAARAESFAAIHAARPVRPYIGNLETSVELLREGALVLPCTVNHREPEIAWVCSPLATYGSYVIEEIDRTIGRPWALPLHALCRGFRGMLSAAAVDQTVTVNNWMLSTNLYPAAPGQALSIMIERIRERWPQHAVWFRSLNAQHNQLWIDALRAQGFDLLPSRQVYLFDDLAQARHANLRRDLGLLKTTPLTSKPGQDFTPDDFARTETLYGYLYLDKYSRLNPHYSAAFMQRWHAAGLLEFWGLADDDGLQAVVGTFRQGDILTAPIVGYNTALPRSLGLYRLLMARVFEVARRDGLRVNLSAGAAHFKRLRGGRPAIEYSAVLSSHLPLPRRAVLRTLRGLTQHVGVPVMQRMEL